MPIDRRFFIFGNAVLFSTLACVPDDGGGEDADVSPPLRDGMVEADLDPEADAHPPIDATPTADRGPDLAFEPDMSRRPDAEPDIDMLPEVDLSVAADAWPADMASEPDAAPDPDMALVPDMAPDPDMALVPDMQPPGEGCAALLGEACATLDEGCCPDGQNPEAVCWGDANGRQIWQSIPADFFCNCFESPETTTYQVACAVPGFVGVERAGRRRHGPRLRDLLAG